MRMKDRLTLNFVHPTVSNNVLTVTIGSSATVEYLIQQLIKTGFVRAPAAGARYVLVDAGSGRALQSLVSIEDQDIRDNADLQVIYQASGIETAIGSPVSREDVGARDNADLRGAQLTGTGPEVIEFIRNVAEILASGVAGNLAYDEIKKVLSNYERRQRKGRLSRFLRRGGRHHELLSRDEAINIATSMVRLEDRAPLPISARVDDRLTWIVDVMTSDNNVVEVFIPQGELRSVPIRTKEYRIRR
jgi:hypothetical protein